METEPYCIWRSCTSTVFSVFILYCISLQSWNEHLTTIFSLTPTLSGYTQHSCWVPTTLRPRPEWWGKRGPRATFFSECPYVMVNMNWCNIPFVLDTKSQVMLLSLFWRLKERTTMTSAEDSPWLTLRVAGDPLHRLCSGRLYGRKH